MEKLQSNHGGSNNDDEMFDTESIAALIRSLYTNLLNAHKQALAHPLFHGIDDIQEVSGWDPTKPGMLRCLIETIILRLEPWSKQVIRTLASLSEQDIDMVEHDLEAMNAQVQALLRTLTASSLSDDIVLKRADLSQVNSIIEHASRLLALPLSKEQIVLTTTPPPIQTSTTQTPTSSESNSAKAKNSGYLYEHEMSEDNCFTSAFTTTPDEIFTLSETAGEAHDQAIKVLRSLGFDEASDIRDCNVERIQCLVYTKLQTSYKQSSSARTVLLSVLRHFQRLGQAVRTIAPRQDHSTEVEAKYFGDELMSSIWAAYASLLEIAANNVQRSSSLFTSLESIVTILPRAHQYPEVCVNHANKSIQDRVSCLYILVSRYLVALVELELISDKPGTDFILLRQELVVASIAVDCATLEEYIFRDAWYPGDLLTDSSNGVPVKVRIGHEEDSSPDHSEPDGACDETSRLLKNYFMGRGKELRRMIASLLRPYSGMTAHCVLTGPEGVGKTQIALKYAQAISACMPAMSIFWISAGSSERLQQGIFDILKLLGHDTVTVNDDPRGRIHAMCEGLGQLGNESRPWLLIIDDIRSDDDVRADEDAWRNNDTRRKDVTFENLQLLLPLDISWGQVILTIRPEYFEKFLATLEPGAEKIEVISIELPDEDSAIKTLEAASGVVLKNLSLAARAQLRPLMSIVAREVYNLPLAVAHVGEFLAHRLEDPKAVLEEIIKLWEHGDRTFELGNWTLVPEMKQALARVFHLTVKRLMDESPREYALLSTLVFFDPNCIPIDFMLSGHDFSGQETKYNLPIEQSISQRAGISVAPYTDSGAMRERDHSIFTATGLSRVDSPAQDTLSQKLSEMVVQPQLIIDWLSNPVISGRLSPQPSSFSIPERVRDIVLEALRQESDDVSRNVLLRAMKLLRSVVDKKIGKQFTDPSVWNECNSFAPHLMSILKHARHMKLNDTIFTDLLRDFGKFYYASGDFGKAAKCYKEILRIEELAISTVFDDTIGSSSEEREPTYLRERLARIYAKLGRINKAVLLLQDIEHSDLNEVPPEDLRVADALAHCYYLKGDYSSALRLYNEVMIQRKRRIQRKEMSANTIINTYEGLAIVLQRLGRYTEAKEHYAAVIERRSGNILPLAFVGDDNEDVIKYKKQLGWQYIALQRAHFNEARLIRDMGGYEEAERDIETVFKQYRLTIGASHLDTLSIGASLANMWAHQESKREAGKTLAEDIQRKLSKTGMQRNPVGLYAQWTLAYILGFSEDEEAAKNAFTLVIDGYEAQSMHNHLFTSYIRRDMCDMLRRHGKSDEAIRSLETVKEMIRGSPAATMLAQLLGEKAETRKDVKLQKRAEALAEETYKLQRSASEYFTPDTSYTLLVMGRLYWKHGEIFNKRELSAKAIETYKLAMKGYNKTPGAMFGHPGEVRNELIELVRSYESTEEASRKVRRIRQDFKAMPKMSPIPDPVPPLESFDNDTLLSKGFFWAMNSDLRPQLVV